MTGSREGTATATPTDTPTKAESGDTRWILAAAALFGVSGVAALIYQVAWQRILALQTGVGIYSISIIVGAFLAGLGLGSHMGGMLSPKLGARRALAVFVSLELSIGLFASISTWLYYDLLYVEASWLYDTAWLGGLAHFLSLLIPTCLMGMSLPLLVRAFVAERESAARTIAYLYGLNVLGASVGALLTPWLLIPNLGVRGAVWTGAAANLIAAGGALAIYFLRPATGEARVAAVASETSVVTERSRASFGVWCLLYLSSGFCAIGLEILWFRLIDVSVRSTAFTFGTVLSIYLLGLAIGTILGARFVPRVTRPLRSFLVVQAILLLYSAVAVILLVGLPTDWPGYSWLFEYWGTNRVIVLGRSWALQEVLTLYVALPIGLYGIPTVLMGLSFTILQRAVQDDPGTSGRKVGLLQASNILGNVGAALLVGLVALAWWGTAGALRGLVGCGLFFTGFGIHKFGARSVFAVLSAALLVAVWALPSQLDLWFRLHAVENDEAFLLEDATGVVAIRPDEDRWRVSVNGRTHSWIPYGGFHSWLGAVPALIHPSPRQVAVIGLGSGDTAWASATRSETQQVHVFEIAAPQRILLTKLSEEFSDSKLRRMLADERLVVEVADGRNALTRSDRLYDLIILDAIWPNSAGSGNLYSVEFYERCARKLKPGGLMATWGATPRVQASFATAFPHVFAFQGGQLMLGSNHPIPQDVPGWSARLNLPDVRSYLGETTAREILEYLPTAERRTRTEVELNRDLFPRDEFLVPQL